MSSIKHQLTDLRPSLRKIAPLSWWITVCYVFMNFIIGATFIAAFDQNRVVADLLIVNQFTSYRFWGIAFIALGAFQLTALYMNNWKLTKKSLLSGVLIKTTWAIALCLRALVSSGTLLIALPWITLALIQMVTVIFFLPPLYDFRERGDEDHDV